MTEKYRIDELELKIKRLEKELEWEREIFTKALQEDLPDIEIKKPFRYYGNHREQRIKERDEFGNPTVIDYVKVEDYRPEETEIIKYKDNPQRYIQELFRFRMI